MKKLVQFISTLFNDRRLKFLIKIGMGLCVALLSSHIFAADLLDGTTSDAIDTMKGAGKHWAYIIDGAISLGAFAYTKKPFVFFSILGVALGITAITKLAGA